MWIYADDLHWISRFYFLWKNDKKKISGNVVFGSCYWCIKVNYYCLIILIYKAAQKNNLQENLFDQQRLTSTFTSSQYSKDSGLSLFR